MSLWDGIFGRRKVKLSDPAGWNLGDGSYAGVSVTPDSAMTLAAAWACVRLRSRVVGSMPLPLYDRLPDGSRRINRDHWVAKLINDSPNYDQTPAEFWAGMVACIDLWGNAYAEKVPGPGGKITALQPMRPEFTRCFLKADGSYGYRYSPPTHGVRDLTEDEVFHLKGFTIGGKIGLSAISYGRHSMGLALAADKTAAKTFKGGMQLAGFMKLAAGTKMTKEQRGELIELFQQFMGSEQTGKVMPLEAGWEFVPVTMNAADAQLLESRAFSVEEVCRWFATPPILVGHSSKSQTMFGSGVEQIIQSWVTLDLDPMLVNIQQAIRRQLIPVAERKGLYAEYNRKGLLRADSKGRAELYASAAQNGWMTRNEIREDENEPPLPGGDVLTVQSNLVPLDQLGALGGKPTPDGFGLPPKAPPDKRPAA